MTYLLLRFATREQALSAIAAVPEPAELGHLEAMAIHDDLDRIIETARDWAHPGEGT